MKNVIRFLTAVFMAGGLAFFASAAPTVEIAAGETLVVTDFTTIIFVMRDATGVWLQAVNGTTVILR